ncbi:MAG: plastocyanin/azurin family copper-binding protein [Solirubrobacterales bacterium]|jgi:plastocyanin
MRRGLPVVLIACSALVFAAGCGSSKSSSSTSTATTTSSTSPSGGLKPATTPKYAAPAASAPLQSGTVKIAYRSITIAPDTLKVKVGSTIEWTNYDSVEHNVTSRGGPVKFASKNFGEGGTFTVKATKPGVIHYLCTIHPTTMNGTIEVVK